ncbi:divergent polysaccharide deacetylase family protein [Maribius pontilimi]|uniref:Divergent polysaccharide deacetylase family protein n=1 Tax=Palleronia pontilimi TaxID=1964209 RepID=A0A934MDJ6_9RHOB|nr:divergent polysaccharide deacetylase family protein [Palleronia pontilimi]MBJ3763560.1 divergent polysaccharide deacetylase family protein [Palleronia pontilimi]
MAAGLAVSAGLIVVSSQTFDETAITLEPSDQADSMIAGETVDVTTAAEPTDEMSDQQDQAEADAPSGTSDVAAPETDMAAEDVVPEIEFADAEATDTDTGPATAETAPEDGGARETTEAAGDDGQAADTAPDQESVAEEAAPPVDAPSVPSEMEGTAAVAEVGEPATDTDAAPRVETSETSDTTAPDDAASPSVSAEVDGPAAPADGVAPDRPEGSDRAPVLAEGTAPIAPVADTAPPRDDVAPPVDVAASPSLDQPTGDSDVLADGAPDGDAPILPVPESLPPATPQQDSAPDQADAPRRASAPATEITGGEGSEAMVAPSALIDGDRVTERSALETAIRSGDRPADKDDAPDAVETRAPDPTGRDRVRVNRLAQIEPIEPAPDSDETVEADTGDDATTPMPDPSVPSEDALLSEDATAEDEAETEEQAAASTRRSSNLIERRLQAATAQSGDSAGQADQSGSRTPNSPDSPASQRTAALAPDTADPASPETADPEAASQPAISLTGVAMDDYGQPFDNPAGLPIVSVVLLDYGGPMIDLPLALSVALDAGQPKVAARAAQYRAQGYEVLVIPSLPRGGAAQDIEQALQASLGAVDGAVAVLPDPSSDVQDNRAAIETLVGRLGDSGLGLVSFAQGLNRAQQIAARENVPAGLVFRQIDGEGQDLRAVKRFLDQAAFRARQENAVILVGRNRPETRGALMEWRLGNRAESVELAPVTAAIRALSP